MIYRIGTRGSQLALAQAGLVRKQLQEAYPEHQFELTIVKTTGDRLHQVPMQEIGAKGIFIKELEERLLEGSLDLAVHSMKDMPAELPDGLMLAGSWMREDARDVLILREKRTLAELATGAVIGTGSLRRKYQLLALRPDLEIVGIRGNVETRIRKMEEQGLDGIVLAAAGLKRLSKEERITQYLDIDEMVPAPAQGALALELASDREDVKKLLSPFADDKVQRAVAAERHFLSLTGVGCHQPVGAYAVVKEQQIQLQVMLGAENGQWIHRTTVQGTDVWQVAEEAYRKVRQNPNMKECL